MGITDQIYELIILSMAISSISWTVTQEEIFAETRKFCVSKSKNASSVFVRKFFYAFTCEYCFSHWVTAFMLLLTGFRLVLEDWRGLVIAFFVLPWLSNQWMSFYRRLRVDIKREDAVIDILEDEGRKS